MPNFKIIVHLVLNVFTIWACLSSVSCDLDHSYKFLSTPFLKKLRMKFRFDWLGFREEDVCMQKMVRYENITPGARADNSLGSNSFNKQKFFLSIWSFASCFPVK